jgi:hypothetical protein
MRLSCRRFIHRSFSETGTLVYSITLALAFLIVLPLSAQAATDEDWQRIGDAHVIATNDMVNIRIKEQAKNTPFKTLRFHVTHGDLKLRSAKVHMNDGHAINLSIQKLIKAGLSSRELTIPDHSRAIKKVVLYYQAPVDHSADVTLYAKKPSIKSEVPQ